MKKTNLIILLLLVLLCVPPVFAADYYTGSTTQDIGISWEPDTLDLFANTFLAIYSNEVTSVTLTQESLLALPSFTPESIEELSCPNLTAVTGEVSFSSDLNTLTALSFPSLTTLESSFTSEAPNLASLVLSSLESVSGLYITSYAGTTLDLGSLVTSGDITISGGTNLSSIDLSSLVPATGGSFDFSWNALTATSVNAILARFVANAEFVTGTIALDEGTNAAPTGQGLTDVTTLRARGVTVTVNGE